eukprot:GABU01004813.1.p2 GENE.GABU01004813.1~~GABU01004813.1.p2  ORF type:complete len:155 (-),score=11.93 GABU01004813.1:436-831(-)
MMDFEFLHANEAVKSGLYVTYYSDAKKIECGRVGSKSKCFCGHLYAEHDVMALKKKITSKCKNCPCKDFKFIPTRPEECGMYWLPRRKEFKVSEWKPKCKMQNNRTMLTTCGSFHGTWMQRILQRFCMYCL